MRPWIVWGTGLLAYIVAVLDRTTFGVSGLDAADRFTAGPSLLPTLVLVQVLVYAAMQVPAGLLLDRFGSRVMITAGLCVLSAGQLTLGLTRELPIAIGAYGLVGLGDAFIFISVIRLLPAWFPPTRVPLLTQLTGITGQFGQILSAVPFLALLLHHGWTVAYVTVAAIGTLAAALSLAMVRDAPPHAATPRVPRALRSLGGDIAAVWSRPGTRLGFFTHFSSPFSMTVFSLMWGIPYLTTAQGMSQAAAGAMLTLSVGVYVVFGVLIGTITAARPQHRVTIVLTLIGSAALTWAAVLALPGQAPRWLLVLLVAVSAIGQPVSMVAFDFARIYNPPAALGTAQGMVNTGGFIAAVLLMPAMGVIISLAGGYSFTAFRLAWAVQYVIWAVGAVGVALSARDARHSKRLGEVPVPVAPAG